VRERDTHKGEGAEGRRLILVIYTSLDASPPTIRSRGSTGTEQNEQERAYRRTRVPPVPGWTCPVPANTRVKPLRGGSRRGAAGGRHLVHELHLGSKEGRGQPAEVWCRIPRGGHPPPRDDECVQVASAAGAVALTGCRIAGTTPAWRSIGVPCGLTRDGGVSSAPQRERSSSRCRCWRRSGNSASS